MGKIAEAAAKAVAKRPEYDDKFQAQLKKYKDFKDKMAAAGVEYGDTYDIPLMARIGHAIKPR